MNTPKLVANSNAVKDKLPVTIITGFLGSGKTTLVNHILTNQQGLRTAVLVNEFGDIGIDGDLILSVAEDRIELSNGCVCCTMNGDLMDAIFGVLERDDQVDSLIVETTGVADPLPVALTFLGPEFRELTRLDSILTVADAENFSLDRFQGRAARNQLVHGDIVLLNKCDLVGEEALRKVEAKIRAVNPLARILRTTRSQAPLASIFGVGLGAPDRDTIARQPGHLEEDRFTSLSFETDRPLNLDKFQYFLDHLPRTVFRAKGILWIDGREEQFIFHLTGTRFTLEGRVWTGPRGNRLVLIGQELERSALQEQLQNCVTSDAR